MTLGTAKMSRLTVAGTLEQLPAVLAMSAKLQTIHLVDHSGEGDEDFGIGAPHESLSEIAPVLTKVRAAASHLNPDQHHEPMSTAQVKKALENDFEAKVDDILANLHECEDSNSRIETLESELEVLSALQPLGLDIELLSGYESLEAFVGEVSNVKTTKDSLSDVVKKILIFDDGKSSIAVFCKLEEASVVQSALTSAGLRPFTLPEATGSAKSLIGKMEKEVKELTKKVETLSAAQEKWSNANSRILLGTLAHLELQKSILEAPTRVAISEHAFIMDGWVKSREMRSTILALKPLSTHIEAEEFVASHGHHHDTYEELPPIEYVDRSAAKPFELLTDLVGRPRYGRLDPTNFMLITFPLFFGLMLGDMVYGMFTILLGLWIGGASGKAGQMGHTETGKMARNLLLYMGISTFIFGLLYGEAFGFEVAPAAAQAAGDLQNGAAAHVSARSGDAAADAAHTVPSWLAWMSHLYPEEPLETYVGFGVHLAYPFHRVGHNMGDLILISIYLGVLHLALGYLIGWRDVAKEHGMTAGFFEKGSWLVVLFSTFAAAYGALAAKAHNEAFVNPNGAYLADLDLMLHLGLVGLVVGLISVIWGLWKYEGFGPIAIPLGPMETVSLLSNTLSYLRLMAIGVVGVKIAEAGNQVYPAMADALSDLFSGEPIGLLLFILYFMLWAGVQIFAWVLGVFSPSIHTARLHFVEWMGKFHEGSGEPFNAFGEVNLGSHGDSKMHLEVQS